MSEMTSSAHEVRTLAQRTRESTDEIQDMISKLQAASQDVFGVTELSKVSVETGSDQVNSALESLSH